MRRCRVGVTRHGSVVNFAHGEMMTIAMYLAIVLFTGFGLDPLAMMVPIAAVLFVFGYAMQAGLINRSSTGPNTANSSCWSRSRSSSSTSC